MKTLRLHYDDPLNLEAEAEVIAHARLGGAPSVILDRTPFYPESGGQRADRGTLGDAAVLDVQIDDEGRVHHLLAPNVAAPPVGARVLARVQQPRRRVHMALHTGQHALSRAVLDQLGAVTLSSRLGETACTLDVDVPKLTLERLQPIQDAVNQLIDEDRPVRQRFVTDAQLAGLDLRKPPPDTDRVRVVEIEGFDRTPCGGTHVTHTAQIELLVIRQVEGYKGGSRITFEAGPRARALLLAQDQTLRETASRLRCAPPELPRIVQTTIERLAAAKAEAGALRGRLADVWAEKLRGSHTVIARINDGDPALLKAITTRLAKGATLLALAAPNGSADKDGTLHLLIARGPDRQVHAGDLLRAVAGACGGRGGGRAEQAQGQLPGDAPFEALVRDQLSLGSAEAAGD